MGRIPSGVVLFAAGIIFLTVAWRGHIAGELPAGRSGFRPYRPNRVDNPAGFYFYLAFYSVVGVVWMVWSALVFLGMRAPIRWR